MGKPRKETHVGRISRLLKSAFAQAELGNEKEARSFWRSALNAGYVVNPKTEKGLEIAIKKGLPETRKDASTTGHREPECRFNPSLIPGSPWVT